MNLGRRRIFVPEVVQTSVMDCGPASLKCLAEGFGIPVSYGRLREACQTDVDGTSIDTMEEVAVQLGLEAEQIMAPADFLLLPEANLLPAIAVVLRASKVTHFVVAWRGYGGLLQVMDPAIGRQWEPKAQFVSSLYIHTLPVSAKGWREWAESEKFTLPLRRKLDDLGISGAAAEAICRIGAGRSRVASFSSIGGRRAEPRCNCPIRGITSRCGGRAGAGTARLETSQSRPERRTRRNPIQLLVRVVSAARRG